MLRPAPSASLQTLIFGLILSFSSCSSPHYAWLRLKDTKQDLTEQAQEEPKQQPLPADDPVADAGLPISPSHPTIPPPPQRTAVFESGSQVTEHSADHQDTAYYTSDHPRKWNSMAVVSLPVALIGVGAAIAIQSSLLLGIAGALALALALIGGRHARDHDERGRGFAMLAMIIGSVSLFLALLVFATGG